MHKFVLILLLLLMHSMRQYFCRMRQGIFCVRQRFFLYLCRMRQTRPLRGKRQGSLLLVRDSTLLCQKIPCQD